MSDKITIKVLYFAALKDAAGVTEEQITTTAENAEELYHELSDKYDFTLPSAKLSVALNDEFTTWETALSADDTVAFLPPMSGG